jgi:hypothetical protein
METSRNTAPRSETPTFLFPATVKIWVLEQHEVLRLVLQRLLDETTSALATSTASKDGLVESTRDLANRFRGHLAFEERHLIPILANESCWGQERVAALREEHERQRAELETLMAGVEGDWDAARAAFVVRSLVTDLLLDMEEEERGVLAAECLSDEMTIVGRSRE